MDIPKKIFIKIVNQKIRNCGAEVFDGNDFGLKTKVWLIELIIKKIFSITQKNEMTTRAIIPLVEKLAGFSLAIKDEII